MDESGQDVIGGGGDAVLFTVADNRPVERVDLRSAAVDEVGPHARVVGGGRRHKFFKEQVIQSEIPWKVERQ